MNAKIPSADYEDELNLESLIVKKLKKKIIKSLGSLLRILSLGSNKYTPVYLHFLVPENYMQMLVFLIWKTKLSK